MDRNDRNILILGLLILFVLALGYYFLLFSPLREDYLAKYDQRTQREVQKADLEQTVAELESVRRNAPDTEKQALEYSKRIPEQDEIPTLVVQIEEIAREAQVTQLRIEPGSPQAGDGDFSRIPLTMSFEGTYEGMEDFVLRLRNLARLVTINGVTYCRQGQGAQCPVAIDQGQGGDTTTNNGTGNALTIKIEAETYVQPAAGGTTGGGGPGGGGPGGGTGPSGGSTTPAGGASKGGGKAKQ